MLFSASRGLSEGSHSTAYDRTRSCLKWLYGARPNHSPRLRGEKLTRMYTEFRLCTEWYLIHNLYNSNPGLETCTEAAQRRQHEKATRCLKLRNTMLRIDAKQSTRHPPVQTLRIFNEPVLHTTPINYTSSALCSNTRSTCLTGCNSIAGKHILPSFPISQTSPPSLSTLYPNHLFHKFGANPAS